ncbi:KAP family P-loop NTPase fold protein [Neobacillus vireti]|uniref:KAP family P-loop NTPase fold protein n=1 Tax=Neobacillus vireti TaxID=220686 RepID=UPI002FFEE5D1
MKKYSKQIITILVGFSTLLLILSLVRYIRNSLHIPEDFGIVAWVIFLVCFILILYVIYGPGTKNFFLIHNILESNRHLWLLIFSITVVTSYFSGGNPKKNFRGDILSDMFDVVFYFSIYSLLILIFIPIINKIINRTQKEEGTGNLNSKFLSDDPISSLDEDKLERRKFAESLVKSILMSNGKLVIGIYGPWGSGKSSFFTMMGKYFPDEKSLIHFTPWYFGENNHAIIPKFLDLLADSIKESQDFNVELEKEIKKYSSFFRSIQVRPPGLIMSAGELFRGIFPEEQSVYDTKTAITKMLKESNKNIVVFIDDLDRLDTEEIAIVFKLVRLVCDFPKITYILALDEEVVSFSLGQMYGKSDSPDSTRESGREYLEKFIQVPLYLPSPDDNILEDYFYKQVEKILVENNIKSEFIVRNYKGVYPVIHFSSYRFSIRNIKRYLNLVQLFIPILKNEVFVDDLLYLLFIKISSPGLYEWIRKNKNKVLQEEKEFYKNNQDIQQTASKYRSYQMLIEELFPNMGYAYDGIVRKQKINPNLPNSHMRVSSGIYFQKYFMYTTPYKEISQEELNHFYDFLLKNDPVSSLEELRRLEDLYSEADLLRKMELDVQYQSENSVYPLIALFKHKFNESEKLYKQEIIRLMESYYRAKKESFMKSEIFNPPYNLFLLKSLTDDLNFDAESTEKIKCIILDYFKNHSLKDIFNQYSEEELDHLINYWIDNEKDTSLKRQRLSEFIINFEKYQEIINAIWSQNYSSEPFDFYRKALTSIGPEIHDKFFTHYENGQENVKYTQPFTLLEEGNNTLYAYLWYNMEEALEKGTQQKHSVDLKVGFKELISIFLESEHAETEKQQIKELLEKIEIYNQDFE